MNSLWETHFTPQEAVVLARVITVAIYLVAVVAVAVENKLKNTHKIYEKDREDHQRKIITKKGQPINTNQKEEQEKKNKSK